MTLTTSTRRAGSGATLLLGAAALLCTGLAACSSGGTPTSASANGVQSSGAGQAGGAAPGGNDAAGGHPCSLLTRAEASAADGQSLGAGAEDAVLGSCSYLAPDFSGVTFTVSSWQSITNAAHGNGGTPPAVSGVGDEAYFGVGLSVRKGTKGFLLEVSGPNIDALPDHGLAKQKILADLMLPRL